MQIWKCGSAFTFNLATIVWNFQTLYPKNSRIFLPVKFVFYLKSSLLLNIFYHVWMSVKEYFAYEKCVYQKLKVIIIYNMRHISICAKEIARGWSAKKAFLKISQNSQENTCARACRYVGLTIREIKIFIFAAWYFVFCFPQGIY